MPVREYKGTIVKPKVREYKGRVLSSMTASPLDSETIAKQSREQSIAEGEAIQQQIPLMQRLQNRQLVSAEQGRAGLPALGAVAATVMVPGVGLVPLVKQALAAGTGAYLGSEYEQSLSENDIDTAQALDEAASMAGSTLVFGGAVNAIAPTWNFITGAKSKMPGFWKALKYAKDKNVPLPVGETHTKNFIVNGIAKTLGGDVAMHQKARQAAGFISRMSKQIKGKPVDMETAATATANYVDDTLRVLEEGSRNAFKSIKGTLGVNTEFKLNKFTEALKGAQKSFIGRGAKNPLKTKVDTILKNLPKNNKRWTVQQADEALFEIQKLSGGAKAGTAKNESDMLIAGLLDDLDNAIPGSGFSATNAYRSAMSSLQKKYALPPGFSKFRQVKASGDKYINSLFSKQNTGVINRMKQDSPELFDNLLNARIQIMMDDATTNVLGQSVLNGEKLAKNVRANKGWLKNVMPEEQFSALENFALYTEVTKNFTQKGVGNIFSPQNLLHGAEGFAAYNYPFVVLPAEGGAYALTRALTNPNGFLYKMFSEGMRTGTHAVKGAEIAGQVINPMDATNNAN